MLLSCESFFKYQSVFCVHGVFKCNKLAIHFKLFCKYSVNYSGNNFCGSIKILKLWLLIKLLTEVTMLVLTVTINCRMIILMMLFITSTCKSLKTDPSREICTYATWLKPSFVIKHPDKLIYVCYCSTWICLVLWGVIRK